MYYKYIQLLFVLFFLCCSQKIVAQQNTFLDSVEVYLNSLPEKEHLIKLIEIPYDKIVANTSKSSKLFSEGLQLAKKNGYTEAVADIYNKLALINGFLGNNDKRLDYNIKAIHIYEQLNNKSKAGSTYADLGFSMKNRAIEKAKHYMRIGIHLLIEDNNYQALNSVYDNYGVIQEISGNLDSAIYYYHRALELKVDQNDSIGIPFALGHLSGVYLIKKDFVKSKNYLDKAYQIRKIRNDIYGTAECLVLYGDFYFAQENYNEALVWFNQGYESGVNNKFIHLAQYAAEYAALCYEKKRDFIHTVKFLKIQQELKDSMLNETTNNQIAELEIKYETEKKEKEIAEQNVQISKEQIKVKQRNYILIGLVLIVIFILILGRYIYKQEKQKQLQLIEENRLKDQLTQVTLQNEIHEERLRISRDLHDNIGSQLTFIISSVDNLSFLSKSADEKFKLKLTQVSNFTRTTISQLRDTVWAMNKDEISMENMKIRLLHYLEQAKLAQENVQFIFNINSTNNVMFNSAQGIHVYRIIQEAINNAVKYAAASIVSVLISEINDNYIITITDDGIGFNMNKINIGNGLESMRNRAVAIHGRLEINSILERGTEIKLILHKKNIATIKSNDV